MTKRASLAIRARLSWLLAAGALACGSGSPQAGDSQTNWLRNCASDTQCGGLACVCGVCTLPCSSDAACASLPDASCVASTESGAIAQCGGQAAPSAGMCLPRCGDGACGAGEMCVAGVCTPEPESAVDVTVDSATQYQVLTGFGAAVPYAEPQITTHARRPALNDAIFIDLGLDVLRLRDRYGHADNDLSTTRDLVDAAIARLGREPALFMTSWSPPPSMKANGTEQCSGNLGTCTMVASPDGSFDYAAFGEYWRASLEAYAQVGIFPEYIGIQNNPDWIPTAGESGEACRFLPVEGTVMVTGPAGGQTPVTYPGFAEAQAATREAIADLPQVPKFLAPETSTVESAADYVFDFEGVDALGHHLYGTDPLNLDPTAMTALGDMAREHDRPIFQTEMQADGWRTAALIHYATVVEGSSAYFQGTLTSSASGPAANPWALIGIDASDFYLLDAYYAMLHYARYTDPGWTRIEATSGTDLLLASAWTSPDRDAVTVILVNAGATELDARLDFSGGRPPASSVIRTVFDSRERASDLGELGAGGLVRVPPHAVVTVALSE